MSKTSYYFFISFLLVLATCYSVTRQVPSWPSADATSDKTQLIYPTGFLTLPSEVVIIRKKLADLTDSHVSPSLLHSEFFQAPQTCSFIRLGPGPLFSRTMHMQFSNPYSQQQPHGFGIDAVFTQDIPQEESNTISLWYDFHGRLTSTITLPRLSNESEKAGSREEFWVFTFLPETQEWVAEAKRLVGPPSREPWMYLPQALLVDRQDPYHNAYRASAYLICKKQTSSVEKSASKSTSIE